MRAALRRRASDGGIGAVRSRARLGVGRGRHRVGAHAGRRRGPARGRGARDVGRADRRASGADVAGSPRPAGGVRESPAAGGVDRVDGARRDRGGRRARHPAARRRRVPRPDPAGVVEPGAVEPDPALEPRGDRRGDRPVHGAAGRTSGRWSWRAGGATSSGRSTARSRRGCAWRPSRRCAPAWRCCRCRPRPPRRARGAHVRPRGARRQHRGPADRALAGGRSRDRPSHRGRHVGRRRASACSASRSFDPIRLA